MQRLADGSQVFERRNASEDIAPMEALVAAHRPQHQNRQDPLFEHTAGAGAVRFVTTAFPAVKLLERASPRGGEYEGRQSKYLLARVSILPRSGVEVASSSGEPLPRVG
jgi:hypothetical protein